MVAVGSEEPWGDAESHQSRMYTGHAGSLFQNDRRRWWLVEEQRKFLSGYPEYVCYADRTNEKPEGEKLEKLTD